MASVISLYGPRTTLIIALPSKSRDVNHDGDIVFEVTLVKDHTRWEVSRDDVVLGPTKKMFGKCMSDSVLVWGESWGGIILPLDPVPVLTIRFLIRQLPETSARRMTIRTTTLS